MCGRPVVVLAASVSIELDRGDARLGSVVALSATEAVNTQSFRS